MSAPKFTPNIHAHVLIPCAKCGALERWAHAPLPEAVVLCGPCWDAECERLNAKADAVEAARSALGKAGGA